VAIEGIARDITERIRSLEEFDHLRNEFLAMVTHELKTPLAAIKGSAATALGSRRPLDLEETQELFQIIDEQSDRLRDLADNLLDMTRIEAGTLTVTPEPMNLREAIEDARKIFVRSGRSQELRVELPESLPLVKGDKRRVVQVLTNLLNNAAKFSPPTSQITVQVEHDAAQATVCVRDEGRGIPKEKLSDLFKKFSQVHETGRAPASGTGLGLAICKGVVEAHGGRIWAESAGEGKGSTFSFTLPVAVAEEEAAARAKGWLATSVRRGERTRVLAVDDELHILRYLRRSLDDAGYQSIVTSDPSQVMKLVEMEEPDIVLLDLRLPGISGFELLQRIREFSDVPIIFLTASARDQDTVSALKMGAYDYVTKPFSPSELLARIEAALRRRALPGIAEQRPPFVAGELEINFAERRVTLNGKDVSLSATEYKLLHELATHAGQVLTYDQILHRVWGEDYSGETELVRSFVRNLRRKLGDDAKNPRYILTERQVGYRMAKS
jgi:DNA-binding response OmpR family regulator/two-component sensor histidine kinase